MIARIETQLRNKDMGLELTDNAKKYLAKKGFDPVLGARPLRRTIQREIEDTLSERILFNELRAGPDRGRRLRGRPGGLDNVEKSKLSSRRRQAGCGARRGAGRPRRHRRDRRRRGSRADDSSGPAETTGRGRRVCADVPRGRAWAIGGPPWRPARAATWR